MTLHQDLTKLQSAMSAAVREHWKAFLFEGILLVILGLAAIILPPLAGLAVTPLPASALIAGLRILGIEEGLPPLPDLEFAVYEKARPDNAAAALAAVLLTLAPGLSRPTV